MELCDKLESDFSNTLDILEQSKEVNLLKQVLTDLKESLSAKSRTAKYWIQYLHYIQNLKDFIRAERTGNWKLHLQSVRKILNIFAATGHVHYAKSACLYLQQMMELETDYPWVYKNFTENGYHTIRRSNKFWAGLWSDLIIEQVMMRSLKSRGGITRGRGVTESVRVLWANTAHSCGAIYEAMTNLTGKKHKSSEQHLELGQSRKTRDNKDLSTFISWFQSHNPFNSDAEGLRSLSSGITASTVDNVNCDDCESVGEIKEN